MIADDLKSFYGEYLEELDIKETNTSLKLDLIKIKSEYRNKGIGKKIMKELVDYADAHKLTITLTPSKDYGSDINELTQFYKKFGFKMNPNNENGYQDTMIRPVLRDGQKRINEISMDKIKQNVNSLKKALKDESIKTSDAYKLITSGKKLTPEEKDKVKKQLASLLTKVTKGAIFLAPGGSLVLLAINLISKKVKKPEPEEIMENKLVGGRADNETIKDISKKFRVTVKYLKQQLKKGMKIESEHTNDKEKQKEIAEDHLAEFPNYYEELEGVEKKLKDYWKDRLKNKVNQSKK